LRRSDLFWRTAIGGFPGASHREKSESRSKKRSFYRTSSRAPGTRAIGVGYPAKKMNMGLMASNVRPRYVEWRLNDAARHWTGRGREIRKAVGAMSCDCPTARVRLWRTRKLTWTSEAAKSWFSIRGLSAGCQADADVLGTFGGQLKYGESEPGHVGEQGSFVRDGAERSRLYGRARPVAQAWFRAIRGRQNRSVAAGNYKIRRPRPESGCHRQTEWRKKQQGQWELLVPSSFEGCRPRSS